MFISNRMKSTQQTVFDITQHRVYPFEARILDTLAPTTRHHGVMMAISGCHATKAPKPIGKDFAARHQAGAGVAGDFTFAEAPYTTQLNFHGPAVPRRLNSSYERDFVARPTTTLTGLLASEISIIQFDATGQFFSTLTFHHHLHQLMLESPGRIVVHPDFAGKLQRRDTFLALGQQIDRKKPRSQRQLGAMEDAAGGQGSLMMALVTLIYLTLFEFTACCVAALRQT